MTAETFGVAGENCTGFCHIRFLGELSSGESGELPTRTGYQAQDLCFQPDGVGSGAPPPGARKVEAIACPSKTPTAGPVARYLARRRRLSELRLYQPKTVMSLENGVLS